MKLLTALALLAFAGGCATEQQQTENLLSAAGFKTVIASTPEQQEYLKTLKQGKLTAVKRHWEKLLRLPRSPSQPTLCWRSGSVSEIPANSFAEEAEQREAHSCGDKPSRE
jgi:hypothetical protein